MARPLKQWLYKHRDNPYPTKTEKILLALGSQMTLVQVTRPTWSFSWGRGVGVERALVLVCKALHLTLPRRRTEQRKASELLCC